MKLAILGSGQIVQHLLPLTSELTGVEVTAIFGLESVRTQLEHLSATHRIPRVYTDYAECIADADVDTVYVALPNRLHFEFAREALLAGKHVICEKPFTTDLGEFEELRDLATKRGLVLVEAITNQFQSNYLAAKAALPELGRVRLVQCSYSQYSSRYEAFKRGEVTPAFDPEMGGGALMDLGIYNLHFVIGLLGRPSAVHYWANIEHGVDTSGVVILKYEDCTAVCVAAKDSGAPNLQIIQGDQGATLVMDAKPNSCGPYAIHSTGGRSQHFDNTVHPHRMYEEFVEFERMIREHDLAERDSRLDHSHLVLEVALSAMASVGINPGSPAFEQESLFTSEGAKVSGEAARSQLPA